MTVVPITFSGGPTNYDGINAGYWRLKSDQKFTPPYTWTGTVQLHEVMDPAVFGYGWNKGTPVHYDPGLNFHPLYPGNERNVGVGVGRRSDPLKVSNWAEMRDLQPEDPYDPRSGYATRLRVPLTSDPADSAEHDFTIEVPSYSEYKFFWDDVLAAHIVEELPSTIDPEPVSVGLRLDFCNIKFSNMKVTQRMNTHHGVPRDYYPVSPVRILDTRHTSRVPARKTHKLPITGRPPMNATHVIVNAVAVQPGGDGWLTLWSSGGRPNTSNLNFQAGEDIAGFSVVPINAAADLHAYSSQATDLVIDLVGYLS